MKTLPFSISSILLLLLLTLGGNGLQAIPRPIAIQFTEMMEQAPKILICEFKGPLDTGWNATSYELEVIEVLKGDLKGQSITVYPSRGHVYMEPGTRCIAFLNSSDGFEWVGSFPQDQTPEESILFLSGFYDFNAYLVSPSTLSLHQLKEYIAHQRFSGKIGGALHFLDASRKQMVPSNIQFEVDYTFDEKGFQITARQDGMTLIDFPDQPVFSQTAWDPIVSLDYEENMVRPLKVEGELQAIDADGNFEALFWLEAPDELTESEFRHYLAHPEDGMPYWEVDVAHANGDHSSIFMGRGWEGPNDWQGYGPTAFEIRAYSGRENHSRGVMACGYDGDPLLFLERSNQPEEVHPYTYEHLIRDLRMGPVKGAIVRKVDGRKRKAGSVVLTLKETFFASNPNY